MGNIKSSITTASDMSSHSSSSRSKSTKEFEKPKAPSQSKAARLVEEKWCNAFNRHDMRTVKRFASADSICIYKGAKSGMPLYDFLLEVQNISEAFPDNKSKYNFNSFYLVVLLMITNDNLLHYSTQKVRWDSIEEIAPGKVMVKNFVGRGTHTGKPFGFGPFPPIPPTGIVVEEDPCHLLITVSKGKMTKFVIDTYCGDLVGPPGYYQKIGGSYTAPPSN